MGGGGGGGGGWAPGRTGPVPPAAGRSLQPTDQPQPSLRPPHPLQILSELDPNAFDSPPNFTTVWTVLNLGGLPALTTKVAAASLPPPPEALPALVVPYPPDAHPYGGADPPPVTANVTFSFESFANDQNISYFYVNGTSFQPPSSPGDPSLLERIYGNPAGVGYTNAGTSPPPGGVGWNVVDLPLGSVVDVTIRNHDEGQVSRGVRGGWVEVG